MDRLIVSRLPLLLLVLLITAAPAPAANLQPGDLLVISVAADGTTPIIVAVRPSNGAQQLVASGGLLVAPLTLAQGSDGWIYTQTSSKLIRIDPCTGAQVVLSPSNAGLVVGGVSQMCAHPNGDLYYNSTTGIYRVNHLTGAQALLTAAPANYSSAGGITAGPGGFLYAVYTTSTPGLFNAMYRIDATTGAQAPITSAGLVDSKPISPSFDVRDSLYVISTSSKRVSRVDRNTGAAGPLTPLVAGHPAVFWMCGDPDGNLYFTQNSTPPGISRVNVFTGSESLAFSGGLLPFTPTMITTAVSAGCPSAAHHSTWGAVKARYR
jgi:sugar lactone lactonase YvrE